MKQFLHTLFFIFASLVLSSCKPQVDGDSDGFDWNCFWGDPEQCKTKQGQGGAKEKDDDDDDDDDDDKEDKDGSDDEDEYKHGGPGAGSPSTTDHSSCGQNAKGNVWFNDPFFCHQWQTRNVAQRVPSQDGWSNSSNITSARFNAGQNEADINIASAYNQNLRGDGVTVYVTDDGVQGSHEDLSENSLGGYDLCGMREDPSGIHRHGSHGTRVTGLFAAVANNNKGFAGISPKVKFYGNNLVPSCTSAPAFTMAEISQPVQKNAHLWNGSYGVPAWFGHIPRSSSSFSNFQSGALDYNIAYFKANGNDGSGYSYVNQQTQQRFWLLNGNSDPVGSHYAIAHIAAISPNDEISHYSSLGSNLLIAGSAGRTGQLAGTCTTTVNNQYHCRMNGTSSATPVVTGVAALVKEANENISWLDIHAILAMSARDLDETSNFDCGPFSDLSSRKCIRKITNSAGYKHSYYSGFGMVNASRAVNIAKNFQSLPALQKYSQEKNSGNLLTSSSGSGLATTSQCQTITMEVPHDFQIYSLDLSFDISGTNNGANSFVRDFDVTMKMPDNPWAQVVNPNTLTSLIVFDEVRSSSAYSQRSLTAGSHYFKSMQGFGVNARGTWKFKTCMRNGTSNFSEVRMEIYGWSNTQTLPQK